MWRTSDVLAMGSLVISAIALGYAYSANQVAKTSASIEYRPRIDVVAATLTSDETCRNFGRAQREAMRLAARILLVVGYAWMGLVGLWVLVSMVRLHWSADTSFWPLGVTSLEEFGIVLIGMLYLVMGALLMLPATVPSMNRIEAHTELRNAADQPCQPSRGTALKQFAPILIALLFSASAHSAAQNAWERVDQANAIIARSSLIYLTAPAIDGASLWIFCMQGGDLHVALQVSDDCGHGT